MRTETIAVRGAPPVTVRGPADPPWAGRLRSGPRPRPTSPVRSHVLALAWTQLTDADTDRRGRVSASAERTTGRASSRQPNATRVPQQNMAFADRQGAIGMISPGLVPIRRSGDGRLPVPGWTGDFDWVGTIPAEAAATAARSGQRPDRQRQQPPRRRRLPLFPADQRLGPALAGATDRRAARRSAAIWMRIGSRRSSSTSPRRWPCRVPALPARCATKVAPSMARDAGGARAAGTGAWPCRSAGAAGCSRPGTASSRATIYGDELGPLFPALSAACAPTSCAACSSSSPIWCDDYRHAASRDLRRSRSPRHFSGRLAALAGDYGPDWRQLALGRCASGGHGPPPVRAERLAPRAGSACCCRSAATAARSTWRMPGRRGTGSQFGAVHGAGYRADLRSRPPLKPVTLGRRHRPVRPSAVAATMPTSRGCGRTATTCR